MKIVFLGSDDFPVPALRALTERGFAPDLVVTRPDAPRGRGRKIYPQKIRLVAEELGLECAQPEDVLDPAFMDSLRALAPDLVLVVSYGRILSEEFLEIPSRFCLNVHASLLPRYRGAAPIQHAIWSGDEETGVTVMRIEPTLDTGPILLVHRTPVGAEENAGELFARLSVLSGEALVEAIHQTEQAKVSFTPQDHSKASKAPKLTKEQGHISWTQSALEIDRQVRAFTPAPGARTRLGPRRLIILKGTLEEDNFGLGLPGRIMTAGEEGIRVCTGKDIFRILRLKPENGRNMSAGEFVRGHSLPPDTRLG
ncbi:MAG: methionyl-tRNA formyltransferase [Planctomycetota bacterium]